MNLKISSKEDEEKAKSSFVITVAAEYFHAWNCIFRSSIIIYFKYKKEFLSKKRRKKKMFSKFCCFTFDANLFISCCVVPCKSNLTLGNPKHFTLEIVEKLCLGLVYHNSVAAFLCCAVLQKGELCISWP